MTIKLDNIDVLIVEDSATQSLLLKELLETHDMKVKAAVDGIEALSIIENSKPQIIISDIEMPRMNGYELCKRIKMDPKIKHIPVILLTGLKDPMDAILGIECGANGFLTKPCNSKILLSTMKNSIENIDLNNVEKPQTEMEFYFDGKKHHIQVVHAQIAELLLSTYSNAVQQNTELETANRRMNQLYDEVKKKNNELKELVDQKNKFLGMAAHDMRNPLGAIGMFSDLLLSQLIDKLDPKSQNIIERIKNTSIGKIR